MDATLHSLIAPAALVAAGWMIVSVVRLRRKVAQLEAENEELLDLLSNPPAPPPSCTYAVDHVIEIDGDARGVFARINLP